MSNPHVERNIVVTEIREGKKHVSVQPLQIPGGETDSTLPSIIEALGGSEAVGTLPVLDVGDKEGTTGYIDFITPKMMSAPIMRGTDRYGRPFFCFAVTSKVRSNEYVFTVFRRYPTGRVWVGMCGALRKDDLGIIKDLCETGKSQICSGVGECYAMKLRRK